MLEFVVKCDPVIEERFGIRPSIKLQIRDITKLQQNGLLCRVSAYTDVNARTLIPVGADNCLVNIFHLRLLSNGVTLDSALKLPEMCIGAEESMPVPDGVVDDGCSIGRTDRTESTINHPRKRTSVMIDVAVIAGKTTIISSPGDRRTISGGGIRLYTYCDTDDRYVVWCGTMV